MADSMARMPLKQSLNPVWALLLVSCRGVRAHTRQTLGPGSPEITTQMSKDFTPSPFSSHRAWKRPPRNEGFWLTRWNSELAKEIEGLGATRHWASPNWHSQQRLQSRRLRTTSLPASEWPHRNRRAPVPKSYEFWHPAAKGAGIFPLSTALDKPKAWFMAGENGCFLYSHPLASLWAQE